MTKSIVKRASLSAFGLAMLNVAAVMSLRGLPMMAKEGLTMVFYLLFAALLFLLPVSLVSAELATGWPDSGGVYRWVKEAFGTRWGFTAIWLQWIQNVIWYPVQLAFAGAALAYVFGKPELASNNYYTVAVILIVYWTATFINFKGMKLAGKLTSIGVIGGVLVPGALIIILGILWMVLGNPIEFLAIEPGKQLSVIPDFSSLKNIAFLAGIVLLFAGMEVGAVHVKELENPKKEFPKGVFLAMFIILIVFTLGSMSIAAVLPPGKISLSAGILQAFKDMLNNFHLGWLLPIISLCVAFGAVAGVMAWIAGPSKGLLATAKDGALPPFLQHTNKNGIQTHILIVQGLIVTGLSMLYLVMKHVSTAFFLLTAMTVTLYLVMYILLFGTAIKLRYSQPHVERAYKVPGGNMGIWLVAGIGLLSVLFAIVVGFFPPAQLPISNPAIYVLFIAAGLIVFIAAPLIIIAIRKPGWVSKEPIDTENQSKAE